MLNIRGVHFETYEETLSRFPNTLLGSTILRKPYWNREKNEYFFDRSHHLFDTILFFYQSGGIIAKPECFDEDEFQDELRFFGIIKEQSDLTLSQNRRCGLVNFLRLLTDYPQSSLFSKLFAAISVIMISISTITYCLETEDIFEWKKGEYGSFADGEIYQNSLFFVCETAYVCWFALEYILRLIGNHSRVRFLFSPLGFVDLLSIVPYAIMASGILVKFKATIRVLKFLQIFRILKISRYSNSLKLLGRSLFYCKGQISLLLIFFFINCLACGSVLYWVERTVCPSSSTSLMDTIWFCIVSMTTVGYGDIVPRTSLGKLVGSVTILVGIVILFHIFIPVYLSYFALLYEISILQTLERSGNEIDVQQEEPDDIKNHRRKSITSSVRKSRASVVISRSPSTCVKESTSANRKLSFTIKEDNAMRRVKYDYLRKLSSTESPLTTSQKSLEHSFTESVLPSRNVNTPIKTEHSYTENAGMQENEPKNFEYQEEDVFLSKVYSSSSGRSRRQAVYEQPILHPDAFDVAKLSQDSRREIFCSLKSNEFSRTKEDHRKLSLNVSKENLEVSARKSASLQHVY